MLWVLPVLVTKYMYLKKPLKIAVSPFSHQHIKDKKIFQLSIFLGLMDKISLKL